VLSDFPAGGILNVLSILMKQADQTRGVPLAGLPVKVKPGYYLIGLSNVEADKDRNLQLLKERSMVRYPGGLRQQPPRHSLDGKRHAGRARVCRCVQGVEVVTAAAIT
jgi:hypothetical protein